MNKYYDGNVECTTREIYEDGNIYLADCKVNDILVEGYKYGTRQITQVYKPQYYSWGYGNVGGNLPSDAKENVSSLNTNPGNYPFYLGLDVDSDNKVSVAYVCFVRNETEYCLKGYDNDSYETNQDIMRDAYADVAETSACYFDGDYSRCNADGLLTGVSLSGDIGVRVDISGCIVLADGNFKCVEI